MKRLGATVLVLSVFAAALPHIAWGQTAVLSGDINLDGEVNIQDALLGLRMMTGLETTTPAGSTAADANHNGALDIYDVARSLRIAGGLDKAAESNTEMKIRLKLENRELAATLVDSEAARDFSSLLPLTLTVTDYAASEKISYLPRRLTTTGAPPGSDPSIGDIAYYAPWGNLAFYYRDSGYANGLIKLGSIDAGADALNVPGSITVTIELL